MGVGALLCKAQEISAPLARVYTVYPIPISHDISCQSFSSPRLWRTKFLLSCLARIWSYLCHIKFQVNLTSTFGQKTDHWTCMLACRKGSANKSMFANIVFSLMKSPREPVPEPSDSDQPAESPPEQEFPASEPEPEPEPPQPSPEEPSETAEPPAIDLPPDSPQPEITQAPVLEEISEVVSDGELEGDSSDRGGAEGAEGSKCELLQAGAECESGRGERGEGQEGSAEGLPREGGAEGSALGSGLLDGDGDGAVEPEGGVREEPPGEGLVEGGLDEGPLVEEVVVAEEVSPPEVLVPPLDLSKLTQEEDAEVARRCVLLFLTLLYQFDGVVGGLEAVYKRR